MIAVIIRCKVARMSIYAMCPTGKHLARKDNSVGFWLFSTDLLVSGKISYDDAGHVVVVGDDDSHDDVVVIVDDDDDDDDDDSGGYGDDDVEVLAYVL